MDELINQILKFRDERDWQQFHSPSNLAKSITIEAAELLENFQWHENQYNLDEVKYEIADIYIYLLILSHSLNIDLQKVAEEKIKINEIKYPITKSKGNSTKYTKLKDIKDGSN